MTDPVDKFLGDAISAARDHADDNVDDGAHTRLRLRESLANHGASRRKRFTLIAAVIASLFGSTAFAYWAGWRPPWSKPAVVTESHDDDARDTVSMRLPAKNGPAHSSIAAIPDAGAVEQLAPVVVPPPASVETTPAPIEIKPVERIEAPAPAETMPTRVERKPAPVRTVPRVAKAEKNARVETKAVDTKPAPDNVSVAPVQTRDVESAPIETKPTPVETKPTQVTNSAPHVESSKAQPSAELAAYRNAHNLHFRGNDPKAALVAWDAYLAKYPNGSLVPEARYDRAMVLVKLARWSEARAALAPFANAKAGAYGAYQKEAAEVLAAIRDR